MIRTLAFLAALWAGMQGTVPAPGPEWIDVPFDSPSWQRDSVRSTAMHYLGRDCLFFEEGRLWLPDANFRNGEIEFSMACSSQRTFVGAVWRIVDGQNLEHFYLRPHQSGQPDSCQYTPVDNGCSAWQLFGDSSAAVEFPVDQWMRIRLVIWEDTLRAYIDSDEPQLVTRLRRAPLAGGLGLQVPSFAPAHFADFRYRPLLEEPSAGPPVSGRKRPLAVRTWSVSSPFPEASLEQRFRFPADLRAGLAWSELKAEESGVANLGRINGTQGGQNTCLAALTLHAEEAQPMSIDFGFSDRVKVYLNGDLVYAGNDSYRSRDKRFLGTIGLYDSLCLQLREGPNDLLFAVSESFGGWGVLAQIQPRPGISIQ